MKRITTLILFVPIFLNSFLSQGQVTTSGNAIMVDGERYTIRGTCYSPRSIGATWMDYPDLGWPEYTSFRTDISLMQDACFNTIRTYYAIFNQEWMLDELDAAGIKVIVTFPYIDGRSNVAAGDRYDIQSGSYLNYINAFKDHPAILMWSFGNETNYNYTEGTTDWNWWYTTVNDAAAVAKGADPNHPTSSANGEVPTVEALAMCPNVDVWGANVYRINTGTGLPVANTPTGEFGDRSSKPFYYSELGVDAYNHNVSGVDEASQSTGITAMWGDIQWSIDNNGTCSGATFFNWTDEWWKSGDNNDHNQGGSAPGNFYPDGVNDEEYFGLLTQGRVPRQAYDDLKELWKVYCAEATPATFALEDAECSRHLNYTNYDGGFSIVDNPSPDAVNGSEKCVMYERAPVQYAALVGHAIELESASGFEDKTYTPTIDIYTSEANVVVSLNLESTADLTANYPDGRFATYTATTTKVHEWETLEFELAQSRDATVNPDDVDQIALLFNSGDASDQGTYYFDNLRGPAAISFVDVGVKSLSQPMPNTICLADENTIIVEIENEGSTAINFDETAVTVSVGLDGAASAEHEVSLFSGTLSSGATMDVTVTSSADFSSIGNHEAEVSVFVPGDNGCDNNTLDPITLVSDVCVGINESATNVLERMYPNPTTGVINFTWRETPSKVELCDFQGKVWATMVPQDLSMAWDLSEIKSGSYIIRTTTKESTFATQLQLLD